MSARTRGVTSAKKARSMSRMPKVPVSNIEVPTKLDTMTECGVAHIRDACPVAPIANQGPAEWLQGSYASFANGANTFNLMAFEIARINTRAAFDYAQQVSDVKSPSEFIKLSAAHVGSQFAISSAQNRELWAVMQGAATDAAEHMKMCPTPSGTQRVRF